ncbi:hypothetical protein SAMN05421720_11022 [Rhodospira trueperi]|uniref:Uncharacterized protein n=2 Tax=Rhodospira trueperi TaxID=69960 RepID=A0A1G7EXH0_9PROT|nr:hypothetical protein SAMN05421720_11022 [Rhodospira trueperi]
MGLKKKARGVDAASGVRADITSPPSQRPPEGGRRTGLRWSQQVFSRHPENCCHSVAVLDSPGGIGYLGLFKIGPEEGASVMVTVKLILILAVALAALLGYLAVFIFQQWWVIYLVLALTAMIMTVTVIITGGRVEEDEPAG